MQPKIYGVRMYPGGGVICQKVDSREVMELHEALSALRAGNPLCVHVEHVFVVRYVMRLPVKRTTFVGIQLARLMLGEREDLDG